MPCPHAPPPSRPTTHLHQLAQIANLTVAPQHRSLRLNPQQAGVEVGKQLGRAGRAAGRQGRHEREGHHVGGLVGADRLWPQQAREAAGSEWPAGLCGPQAERARPGDAAT